MALSDYRLCDACHGKVFYDAQLNYEDTNKGEGFRTAGKPGHESIKLGYLGDWAVICKNCSKTHRTVVEKVRTDDNFT